jgi:hypothetical protein
MANGEGREMTDVSEIRKRLEALWDDQGSCGSCGWHGLLYEHDIEDGDLIDAMQNHDGILKLGCVNGDYDSSDHRGVKIYLKPPQENA